MTSKRPNSTGHFNWGPKNKLAIHVASGIPVDLFAVPTKDHWWNSLVVRTGGKDTNLIITTTARRIGYTFECYGVGFHRVNDGNDRYVTTSERDIWDFLHLPYPEPPERR